MLVKIDLCVSDEIAQSLDGIAINKVHSIFT